MPKQTFFNLPEEKRTQLLTVALEEFANHDYNSASLSKIVEKVGIAKGSVYQYFDDKQEMFIYLVEIASQQLLAALMNDVKHAQSGDFFSSLRHQMSATVRVNLAHPLLSRLLRRSTQAPAPVRDELAKRLSATSGNYFAQMVQGGIERGDLRPGFDPALISVLLSGLLSELGSYIAAKLNLEPSEAATIDVSIFDSPVVEQVYDTIIDILRNGLDGKALR